MPVDTLQIAFEAIDKGLEKQLNRIDSDLVKLERQIESTDKSASKFGLTAEQVASKMTQIGKAATIGITLPIAGLATAAIGAASSLNETMNKVDVLFEDSAAEIKKWSETSATAFGQSRNQALNSAASFSMFAKSAGLAGNEMVDFAKKHTTLASDLASFNDSSPQEAFEAIGAALRGETEPIRRYNVLINEATLKDEALRQGLIKTTKEALTPQQKILATSALIFQQTAAAQGDYARTSDSVANATRTLNNQFQDTLAQLGQALLPTVQKAVGVANDLLASFNALDQPQKDLIVGFGLMAAAAGPVLTIGGKLIGTLGALRTVSLDAVGGFISVSKTVGETAGYLKQVGVSAESLKFAFQNLKAGGALLGIELGIIAAGLIAIGKYLEEVGNAAKATNEDLIAMSRSGDVFKQAAATTEILANGQDRLKAALDVTHEKIREGKQDYADYRSSIEATAKAAGFEINAAGDLVQVMYGLGGRVEKVIQANYVLSESGRKAFEVSKTQKYGIDLLGNAMLGASDKAGTAASKFDDYTSTVFTGTEAQIKELKKLTDEYARSGQAQKDMERISREAFDNFKANNAVIADAYTLAIQYTESQRKQADVQAELDALNQKIASHGAVRTVTVKNEILSTEELARTQLQLAAAQEDLTTAQRKGSETDTEFALRVDTIKGKIADYSAKLGEHTAVVGGATKAELEQKAALEGQIAALQKTDEVTRAKGAFDALTKSFRDGILAEDEYKERAGALNAITGLYTESALKQATAQEVLMKSFADPRSEEWRSQLDKNKTALDGLTEAEAKAAEQAGILASQKTLGEHAKAADTYREALGKVPKDIEISVKPKIDVAATKGKKLDPIEVPVKAKGETVITPKVDTTKAAKDIEVFTAEKIGAIPKEKKTTIQADTVTATKNTNSLLTLYGVLPKTKTTLIDADAKLALQTLDDVLRALSQITDKTVNVRVNYTTSGNIPEGFQYGGSMIVPPNPAGGAGDYFPILAAPGERVTVETRAQQAAAQTTIAGDTYNYTTNVYNPLAAAMLADKQRRERLARSNARMGVM